MKAVLVSIFGIFTLITVGCGAQETSELKTEKEIATGEDYGWGSQKSYIDVPASRCTGSNRQCNDHSNCSVTETCEMSFICSTSQNSCHPSDEASCNGECAAEMKQVRIL